MKVEPTVLNEHEAGIEVLLVDDDIEWVELIQYKLRTAENNISTTAATSAAEAESVLSSEWESIDCVVCDYHMPGADGLEFLLTVRNTFGDIPFILLTGAGSEDVASEAIGNGISDYIIKREINDDISLLLNRITRAIETARLRTEVQKKRKLYETLLEQTSEGICITQDDEVVLVNDRLASLLDCDESTLIGSSFSEMISFMSATEGIDTQRSSQEQVTEANISTLEDGDRIYELHERAFRINDTSFTLWSFRDITAVSRRKEQLRRERDLGQSIVKILAQSSTDQTVEQAFCKEVISGHMFQFAWVGEPQQSNQLNVQAYAGNGQEYLSAITPLINGNSEGATPPSLWALRSGEAQFLHDISEYPKTRWGRAADTQGFTSAAILPLEYRGISHGVFCLYSSEQSALGGYRQQSLQRLADALAHAIDDKEKAAALTSEQVAEISFRVADDQFYLNNALRGDTAGTYTAATVESVVQRSGSGVVEFIAVEDAQPNEIVAAVSEQEIVESVTSDSEQSTTRLQVKATGMTLGGLLQKLGVRLDRIVIEDGIAEVTMQLPIERDEQAVLDQLREKFDIESVTGYTTKSRQPRSNMSQPLNVAELTRKQRQAVEAALNAGYFERPRDSSATEVAELLGVSHSTFLQHLYAVERKLFSELFN